MHWAQRTVGGSSGPARRLWRKQRVLSTVCPGGVGTGAVGGLSTRLRIAVRACTRELLVAFHLLGKHCCSALRHILPTLQHWRSLG